MDIRIYNLTKDQVDMLDMIWSFYDEDEYLCWYELLDQRDQQQALNLVQLLSYETMEHRLDDLSQARAILKKYQL